MNVQPAPSDRRQDIQILRALAVVLVVFYHFEIPFFGNGFLGVDVFFVISGYLMAKLYNRTSIIGFYVRRIDRLLGAYCFAIALTAIVAFFVLIPADFLQLFEQSVASLLFVPNVHFWNQTSYFEKDAFRPLLNLWSLGVEVQFYLLVPFLYRAIHKRRLWFVCVCLLSFTACLGVQLISPKSSFFMMPLRIWEFLFGAAVAWYFSGNSFRIPSSTLTGIQYALLVALVTFLLLVPITPESRTLLIGHPGLAAFAVCALTALIIYIGMPLGLQKSWMGRVLTKLGDYSYSIYLVHFPAIVLWNYVEFGGTRLGVGSIVSGIGLLSIIIVVSLFSYYLIERRGVNYFRSSRARIGLLIGLAAVLVVSFAANGGKFDQQQKKIFAATQDRGAYRCGKVFRFLNPFSDICNLSKTSFERRVLLVGDSHADAIKDEITIAARTRGIAVFFYARNNPLNRYGYRGIIDHAIGIEADAIILHFDNNSYSSPRWVESFRDLLDSLASRIPILVIAPVPTYPSNVPRELFNLADGRPTFDMTYDRDTHIRNTAQFRSILDSYNREMVAVYDPSRWLCPDSLPCQLQDKMGKPLYFDTNHLTLTGASALRAMFEALFDRVNPSHKLTSAEG